MVITLEVPGGPLGGEVTDFTALVDLQMQSVGGFPGWTRTMTIPATGRFYTAPQVPAATTQDFDIDLGRLQGQIVGDPDFDLLRITAGTDFAMPGPGRTTARMGPGGDYYVDSFFDITYRLDFVGNPGGTFAGMSGSTTNVVRERSGFHETKECNEPDNTFGTADWPPMCPQGTIGRTEGVIAEATPLPLWSMVADFNWQVVPGSVSSVPGGIMGGEVFTLDESLTLRIKGEGSLSGFTRAIALPVDAIFHVGRAMHYLPHQGRPVEIHELFGQVVGDPDFALLRITAGANYALPSGGAHTSLTHMPGGEWAIDSFFDIVYRVDFVGAVGSPLAGLSGSFTGTLRCQMGMPRDGRCIVADNGTGTIDFPPACPIGYQSVRHAPGALNGTPPNSPLLVDVEIIPLTLISVLPGGSLGGQQQASDAMFRFHVVGTGVLAGFERSLGNTGSLQTHTAPHPIATSPQHYETLVHQALGVVVGDPDFSLLRITAGNGFGYPSPGHTTLTAAGVDWEVRSFFDITYRIDFIGEPGGALAGMSGSTTARRHFVLGDQQLVDAPAASLPARLHLSPAAPNPTRGGTTFSLGLPREAHVRATVHDVAGRSIRVLANETHNAGTLTLKWDGRGEGGEAVAPGLYLVRVVAGGESASRRVFFTR